MRWCDRGIARSLLLRETEIKSDETSNRWPGRRLWVDLLALRMAQIDIPLYTYCCFGSINCFNLIMESLKCYITLNTRIVRVGIYLGVRQPDE